MKTAKLLPTLVIVAAWAGLADAQYVVVLKNGRQLTVQSYREEGSTVKILGLGGELGIPKEQIQSISKSSATDRPGLDISNLESPSRTAPTPPKPGSSGPSSGPSDVAGPSEGKPGGNIDEVREYRRRLADVTQKLDVARERYLVASSARNTGAKFDKEGIRDWTADLASRIQDSQKAGGGPADTPLAWSFPAPYTPKAKELSDMRMEINKLEKERNDLIQEMKSKNIDV